jgi:predicted DNA-binding transcriptional regulator AlpA
MSEMVTIDAVQRLTGKSRQGLYYMVEKGYFPAPIKICGRLLWDRNWIDTYLKTGQNIRPDELDPPEADDAEWSGDRETTIALLKEHLHAENDRQLLGKTVRLLETVARLKNLLNDINVDDE